MKDRFKSNRFYPFPKFWRDEDRLILKCRVLAPGRLDVINDLFLSPIQGVWRFIMGILVFDFAFWTVFNLTVFYYTDIDRMTLYACMLSLFIVWMIDRWSRYKFWTYLCGTSLKITFSPDCVRARVGFFRRLTVERDRNLNFVLQPLGQRDIQAGEQENIYLNALRLAMVVNGEIKERIIDIADPLIANKVHANLTTALSILETQHECDIDPTARLLERKHITHNDG